MLCAHRAMAPMTTTLAALVLVCVVVAVSGGVAPPYPCTFTYPASGDTIDLSPLYKASGDYDGTDETYAYKANVCGPVNSGTSCGAKGYAICQFYGSNFIASLGTFAAPPAPVWSVITLPGSPPEPEQNGLQYTFINGDQCWISGAMQNRVVINVFRCIPGPTEPTFTVVEDKSTCVFIVTFRSSNACKGGGSLITSSTYTDNNTRSKWDLTPLHRNQGAGDYVSGQGSYNYSMNIGDLTTVTGQCRTAGHSICQYDYRDQFYAGLGGFYMKPAGVWSLIAPDPTVGIRQTYKNGETCSAGGQQVPRTSIISYYCDATGPRQFQVVVEPLTCTYKFNWYVAEGCPSRA